VISRGQGLLAGVPFERFHIAMSTFVLISIVSFLMGPSSDFHRYMVHLLPVLAMASTMLSVFVLKHISFSSRLSRMVLLGLSAAYLIAFGGPRALRELRELSSFFNRTTEHQRARKRLGSWIAENIPVGETVISSDIGAIAYVAKDHHFIDALGLTSEAPVRALSSGKWERFVEDLRRRRPLWVADTGTSDGRISAFEIIGRPWKFYRQVAKRRAPYLNLYSPRHQAILEIPTADGYVFRLVRISSEVWPRIGSPPTRGHGDT